MSDEKKAVQSTAIVRGPQARLANLKSLFERAKASVASVLPKHLTADKLFKIVTAAASRTPELLDCTPESVLMSVMQAGALGLEPSTPLQLSYLIPFKNSATGKTECQFIPGYRGLIRLAIQSGEVQSIQARVIRERDVYEIEYGLDQKLAHSPYVGGDPGPTVAFYAVAELRNGSKLFEFMTVAEIDALRKRSKAGDNGPWKTDYEEMGKKTVIRRLCKTLPLSEEKLGRALEAQARAEAGTGPDFSEIIEVAPELGALEEAGPQNGAAQTSRVDAMAERLAAKVEVQ